MEQKNEFPEWSKVSEVELIYRSKVKASERPCVQNSQDCCKVLRQVWDTNKIELLEEFKLLLLNRARRVIGVYHLSSGGITGTVVDLKLVLAIALKMMATGIILAHNHPSGNLKPSVADNQITAKIKDGAKYLEIEVLDHIIITSEGYFSFADEGLL